jgi:hypothetical protein
MDRLPGRDVDICYPLGTFYRHIYEAEPLTNRPQPSHQTSQRLEQRHTPQRHVIPTLHQRMPKRLTTPETEHTYNA